MKKIRELFSLLSDIKGTYELVYYFLTSLLAFLTRDKIISFAKTNILTFIFAIALVIVFIMVFLKKLFSSFEKIKISIDQYKVQKTIKSSKIKIDEDLPFKIKDFLPSTNKLKRWDEQSKTQAKKWAADAKQDSFNLYIVKLKDTVEVKAQVIYTSEWKKEKMYAYLGSSFGTQLTQERYPIAIEQKAFFDKYPNWQIAVERAYEKISSKLKDYFKLSIFGGFDELRMYFDYQIGKLECSERFTFDGKFLENSEGKKIKIQNQIAKLYPEAEKNLI